MIIKISNSSPKVPFPLRRLSGVDLSVHRPDSSAGSAGVPQVRRQGIAHPQTHLDRQRIPHAQVGQVRKKKKIICRKIYRLKKEAEYIANLVSR